MGFIGSLVGGTSGNVGGAGMNYQAGNAALMQTVNQGQLSDAQNNVNSGLNQQQSLIDALTAQQGLANQSQVYGQEQGLQSQLQGIANGTGPNPAQAMLNQATGQNVSQQAALMAGQRGASQNVGLIARQAAQQGANTQQQAAGQGATMQAQQSLAAINAQQQQQQMLASMANQQAGQQIGAIGNYNQYAQGAQGNVLNAAGQLNNASVANMDSQNKANSSVSGVTAQNQGNLLGGIMQGGMAMIPGAASGGVVGEGNIRPHYAFGTDAPVGTTTQMPTPAQLATQPGQAKSSFGKAAANGNKPKKGDDGNNSNTPALQKGGAAFAQGIGRLFGLGGPSSTDNDAVNNTIPFATTQMGSSDSATPIPGDQQQGQGTPYAPAPTQDTTGGTPYAPMTGQYTMDEGQTMTAAHGGKVPVMLSPGEKTLSPREAKAVAAGQADPQQVGKKVPGKASVAGDSLKNDTYPTTLESGGVVIPRSVMNSKNPGKEAAKFVQAVMAKSKMKKS